MQSFDTEPDDVPTPLATDRKLVVGVIADLPPGACARVELPDGDDVAVYNVGGEYYAIENSCRIAARRCRKAVYAGTWSSVDCTDGSLT